MGAMPVTMSGARIDPAPAGPWGESIVTHSPGLRVHVRRMGQGPALVALHGFGSTSDTWLPVAPAIVAEGFTLIAPDLPGFGSSDRPGGVSYDYDHQASRILQALDELSLERFAVLGHSLGGGVAMELAVAAPERVSALVLVGTVPPTWRPRGRVLRSLVRLVDEGPVERAEAWLRFILRLPGLGHLAVRVASGVWFASSDLIAYLDESRDSAEALVRLGVAGPSPNLADRLARLDLPTLVVWGDRDRVFSKAGGRRLAKLIPGARLVIFEKAGHVPHAEAGERLVAEVITFLAGQR